MRSQDLRVLFFCAIAGAAWTVSQRAVAAVVTFFPDEALSGDPVIDFVQSIGSRNPDRSYVADSVQQIDFAIIKFAPFASNLLGDTTTLSHSSTFATPGLSGPYAELLSHGLSTDGGPASITFGGLVAGADYDVAIVASGLRVRSDCCEAGAGYNNMFVSGTSAAGGQLIHWEGNDTTARIIHGQFIADASGVQTIQFNAFGVSGFDPLTVSANINAVMLSYAAVPEPNTLVLVGLGASVVWIARRRTR